MFYIFSTFNCKSMDEKFYTTVWYYVLLCHFPIVFIPWKLICNKFKAVYVALCI